MNNDIRFIRGRGGLGRALAGEDHISGIVAEITGDKIPAALLAVGGYAEIFSVQDAEDLGIVYSENNDNLGLDALKYSIDSIFEENDKAVVHLALYNTTLTGEDEQTTVGQIEFMQKESNGKVRQALVLAPSKDFAIGDLSPLQAIADKLEAEHQPLSLIYAPNFVGVDLGTDDLRDLDNKNVSVVAGMDGNGKGNELYGVYGKTFGIGGLALGMVSRASVHENIAWVGQFNANANTTNEFDVLKLADGRALKEVAQSEIDTLGQRGYLILIKHIGKAGSYFNDSHNAVSEASDYAYIENTRTIDKAVRGVREFLLPFLNSPLYVNEDGTLTEDTVATFKNESERALEEMQRLGEISALGVIIDPAQNVLKTSQLSITIKIVPVGVARNIVVNIGFALRVDNV